MHLFFQDKAQEIIIRLNDKKSYSCFSIHIQKFINHPEWGTLRNQLFNLILIHLEDVIQYNRTNQ